MCVFVDGEANAGGVGEGGGKTMALSPRRLVNGPSRQRVEVGQMWL